MPAIRSPRAVRSVFRDLGFSGDEAESLRLRSELMIEIGNLIDAEGLTQVAAARKLGVSQPRVSDLVRGKIELFSIDSLVDMLAAAGRKVTFTVSRPRGHRGKRAA